jgi:hypothetical protein
MRSHGFSVGPTRASKGRARNAAVVQHLARPDVFLFLSWVKGYAERHGRPIKHSELIRHHISTDAIRRFVSAGVLVETRTNGVRGYKLVNELVTALKDQIE